MPSAPHPASLDAQAVAVLIAEAGRPLAGPLNHLPGIDGCKRVIALVQDTLTGQTQWNEAITLAGRIVGCMAARKTEAEDTALVMSELAKAFNRYPPPIARQVAEHVIETYKFRPAPSEIHDAAKARITDLRVAAGVAEKVIKAREHRSEERRARLQEQEEEARAIAEGRETPSQRRARIAAEARTVIEQIRGAPDIHQRHGTGF